MQDAQETLGFVNEDALLPDGWEEGMSLFDEGVKDLPEEMDASEEESDAEFLRREAGEDDAPTQSNDSESGDQSAGVEEAADPTGQSAPTDTPKPKTYHLKVNRKEMDVELTDDEVLSRLQKSYAFDALKEKEQKQLYRKVYQEEIDAGMTERSARQTAKAEAGGEYSLTDEEETDTAPADEQEHEPTSTLRDYSGEVAQVLALYPQYRDKGIPNEVIAKTFDGTTLLAAMSAYQSALDAKTAASLSRENKILKQNAASAAKAPVKGVSGGGTVKTQKKSAFEEGFDSDPWQ